MRGKCGAFAFFSADCLYDTLPRGGVHSQITMKKTIAPETVLSSTGKKLKLVWHDEFDTNGLPDPSNWSYEEGYVRNQELQYYTKERRENARIAGGRLVLEARMDSYRHDGQTELVSSASISTRGKHAWKYGRFEIRARIPSGRGTWPAIWMLGEDVPETGWPRCGEIDIMEAVGMTPNTHYFTLHGPGVPVVGAAASANASAKKRLPPVRHVMTPPCSREYLPLADSFATYVLEWDASSLKLFVDGELVKAFSKKDDLAEFRPYPFAKPHYLILNLAIGGAWGGKKGIDPGIFPAKFEVEYVRVYQ